MYHVMQSCAKTLVKAEKEGSLINLSSQAGHRGEALVSHYCATKAAVISYTQSAALALPVSFSIQLSYETAAVKPSYVFDINLNFIPSKA